MAAAIAIGVGSRLLPLGVRVWDKSVGDVAYAVMIGFIIALVRPRARALAIAVSATAVCVAIELFQLTGIPSRAPRVLRVLLGDTFAWHDLGCYAAGGVLVGLAIAAHGRVTGAKNANG
jgi:hypothetical protein